ncbi:MAG: 2Fe-2S iron-sulfur cluster binding domain-containing protein [Desulfobacterales bacterium]|nr:2Fe-2S iron-sulfur cluster binding domain-containing protein [Desulfobacterales bacterium]
MAITVEFKTSGKTAQWNDSYESLLELAEENGIEIEPMCKLGVCGTCKVRLFPASGYGGRRRA